MSTYSTLNVDKLPAALEVIRGRGEVAVEDCELLYEVGSLGCEWPPYPYGLLIAQ